MSAAEDWLKLIPDIDIDLDGCGRICAHGLPVPVVVTLARRPDRWARALDNLKRSGIAHAIRATAVDGQTLASQQLAPLLVDPTAVDRPLQEYLQLTRPAVGCFLSHMAIWKRFLASGEPHIFVLEDDAHATSHLNPQHARAVIEAMPDDTDMLLLGGTIMDGLAEPTRDPAFTRVYYYNGTYAYLLTQRGCRALMPRLLPLKTHVDNQISLELVADRERLHVYGVEPRLFEHDFTVWSDVYVPVTDATVADHTLASVFAKARMRLTEDGAKLYNTFQPSQ
jgi:glycosyl transferase, family 25